MTINITETIIDEKPFQITQFGATEAIRIQAMLVKKIAPAMASGIETETEEVNIKDAVRTLVDGFEEDEMMTIILRLLNKTAHDGTLISKLNFDAIFTESFTTVYKLVYEVIKVNYGDLFLLFKGVNFGNLQNVFQKTSL